jgi:hypothetical protein
MIRPLISLCCAFLMLAGCVSYRPYEVKNNDLYVYLNKPDAEKVYFLSSLDQFERHEAVKNKRGIWEVTLPPDKSFIYFFIVDETVLVPPCDQRVRDDFGSENCVYMPEG